MPLNDYTPKPRTNAQNRALHLYCKQKAEQLNMFGLEMRVVLKPSYQLWWTPEAFKEHIWKPVQKAMYQKKSTTELSKLIEIDNIHEMVEKGLNEKFGVMGLEYIPFPNQGDNVVLKETQE